MESLAMVMRSGLLARISQANLPRIVLISAPAGYGKTTLAHQIAATVNCPAVWQSLDQWQSDIPNLHRQSVRTWARLLPEIETAVPATKDAQTSALSIMTYLAENLTESCLYILDDVQHIADHPTAEQWLQTLVDAAPATLCLVLVGRTVPTINWSDWVARGQVAAYGIDELRFRVEEVQELAHVAPAQAQLLVDRLGGWIAGIRLAVDENAKTLTRLILGQGEPEIVLFNRLAEALLVQQPIDLQQMLLKTATLRHFTPNICQEIGLGDITPFIEPIVQRNLFVSHSTKGYAYHDLFRDFLQQWLLDTDVATFYQLHHQVAVWYEQSNQMEEAIGHFILAQAWESAIQLVEMVVKEFFIYGQWESLLLFHQLLERRVVPRLSLYCAMIYTDRNDFERSTICLQEAQAGFTAHQDIRGQLNTQMHMAQNYQRQGQYAAALSLVQSILQSADVPDTIRAWAYRLQGVIYVDTGLYNEAISASRCALLFFQEADQIHERSHVLQDLGEAYLRSGNLDEAGKTLHEMVALRRKLDNPDDMIHALNTLGYFYHCCSQYKDALATFQEGLRLAGNTCSRAVAYLYWSYGDVLRDVGRFVEAEQTYESAAKIAPQGDVHLYFGILLSVARLRMWQNRWADAQAWITKIMKGVPTTHVILLAVARTTYHLMHLLADADSSHASIALQAMNKVVDAHATIKVAQLLGLYWLASIRSGNEVMQRHVQDLLRHMGEQSYQPVAAELVNLKLSDELESQRADFPELFRLVDVLAKQHHKLFSLPGVETAQQMRLVTLGQQQILHNQHLVPDTAWTIALARELFLYLYFKGKQKKSTIALVFWSEHSPQQIRSLFHDTLKRVRKALPDGIVHSNGYYMVNPDFKVECDAHEFRDLVQRARHLPPQSVRAEDLYRRGIALYDGEFLPAVFTDWARPLRERLHDMYIEALIGLGRCIEARTDIPAALVIYERAFALAPESELLAQTLMRCYATVGKLADVQHVYKRLKQYLADELAVLPSAETDALLLQLLQ